jgi:hypothetical protein
MRRERSSRNNQNYNNSNPPSSTALKISNALIFY